ncbi:MAG: asparagine synthase (glutamine-hydrolyzing) [Chitinispirillaceae bacterium]
MCGICGFVGAGSAEDLTSINNRLVHRGPDGGGEWVDEEKRVFLGHRRLSIIDLQDGAQPMVSADGDLVVVFNGEIYNHVELRKKLQSRGHLFRTSHSDTEILIHGYREWGENLSEQLNGMWSFAVYDRKRNTLFLSRDRFGQKPLFYTSNNDVFAFASELDPLTEHSLIERETDWLSVKKYFAYGYIPAPGSIYKDIRKLPGGHSLLVNCSDGRVNVRRYWEFRLEPVDYVTPGLEERWCEQLRELLDRAVGRRLMSDVPLGVFLSGGIDSTAVAYYAKRNSTSTLVNTFSVEFEEKSFDESAYSRQAAAFLGTEHHARNLNIEAALEVIPELERMLDEPMGDSSLIATYLLCRETRKHVTVALGGDGADELFAGYDPFRALNIARWYERIVPRPVHRGISMLMSRLPVSHMNMSLDFKIKRALRGLNHDRRFWNPVWMGPLSPSEIGELFDEEIDLEQLYSEAIESWNRCTQKDIVDKTLQFYTDLYLQDDILVKVDRAGMLNSLEVRSPFLDVELAEFVRRIPSGYKFRNGQSKYILKKALESVLPRDIIKRKKKGFGVPLGRWFKERTLGIRNDNPGTTDENFKQKRYVSHLRGKSDERAFLWNYRLLQQLFQRKVQGCFES